ncbi:alpha/beta family hydrolase [Aquabacterium sp. J223]|uniref:alpha/beta hydrolase family protein n=1 Tax=Aquabacterium sp. J223 TaxID=2898431 RepID=UPI0021AE17A2|nr:alpha/beta family hydrolase [Aquabacterium sp. J223]UUX95220.1 alpha/beta hydrolase [Aquabacterium sp. J223]
MTQERPLPVALEDGSSVSALLTLPRASKACYVMAHGAGAGMHHPFLHDMAQRLAERRVATLRFQFPSMERGSKRPDAPATAQAAVRAACAAAAAATGLPLVAGGKSFGGRMTSQAQAVSPLPQVAGLAFLGFPLHPAGQPATARGDHLARVTVPMLFVQGTRDKLADPALISGLLASLGPKAGLLAVADADHGFQVPVRSGRTASDVTAEVADGLAAWVERLLA